MTNTNTTPAVPSSITAKDIPAGWQAQHAWSLVLADRDARLSRKDYGLLIAAINSGLPVMVEFKDTAGSIMTVTAIVESLHLSEEAPSANRIRVRYWGFGHDVHVPRIVGLASPEPTYR